MCLQYYVTYTCGCQKNLRFIQCEERRQTNVKCHPVRRVEEEAAEHMCSKHMVRPGTDEMRRPEAGQGQGGEGAAAR